MYTRRNAAFVLFAAVCAAVPLAPRTVCGQAEKQPDWVNEAWQEREYPKSAWLTGFGFSSQGGKGAYGSNRAAAEESALGKLVREISADVAVESGLRTTSDLRQDGKKIKEVTDENYTRTVKMKTGAEVAGVNVRTWHNPKTGAAYAFAAVKKSELITYYVSQVSIRQQRAENAVGEARQFSGLDRKADALRKSGDAGKILDESAQYAALLEKVDIGGGESKRLSARETALRQEIAAIVAEMEEAKSFYIEGTETLGGAPVDIAMSKMKSVVTRNGFRVVDDAKIAAYSMRVEVRDCERKSVNSFSFCYACIRVDVVNLKTGKSEGRVDLKGTKTSLREEEASCRRAFEKIADEAWAKMKEDIKLFK